MAWNDIRKDEPLETLSHWELDELIEVRSHFTKQQGPTSSSSIFSFGMECRNPPNFPPTIPILPGEFRNWAGNIHVSNMWIAIPRTFKDILVLANWAYLNDFMLRPKGFSNSWAPLTVTKSSSSCRNTVLVDTTQFLIQMKMLSSKGKFRAVQVQTGASMESLLSFLEDHKCGLFAAPVMGEISIGGVLAVSGHGSGLPTLSSSRAPAGYSSGSLSNLILSFKAVVWDEHKESYVIKKFARAERDSRAFLTHMGRAFLTEVTLLVGPAYKLRCQSLSDLSAEKLLASPDDVNGAKSGHETFASLVDKYHSVDLSVFPYTDYTLLMACSNRTKNYNNTSRVVNTPYPFSYLENVPRSVTVLLSQFLSGRHYLAPLISRLNHQFNSVGIRYSSNEDIWGASKNILVRYKSTFTHSFSSGYAILTSRDNLQKVASEVYSFYLELLEKFSSDWQYPQNQPLQITVTGLDDPKDLPPFGKFESPALSILAPVKGKKFNVALVVSVNVYPGTRYFEKFMRELESHLFLKYDGDEALVRPEWAKAWAFTDSGAWDNRILIRKMIPKAYGSDWNWAIETLNQYDPHHIFSNDFIKYVLHANSTLSDKQNKLSSLKW
ncbi:unnamed protein product [Orchesella dallaii]|uniref:FAD-binding PCMH-type domain-containing protein n=1 Tax=Orchesella dallaii TaxID=48710 RepID=A0ABP1PMT4_9HEXA